MGPELPTFKEAYRMIVKPGEGPISRKLNRHLSLRITLFLLKHRVGISPTAMSFMSFATGLLSALAFSFGWPLPGGLLAQLASILDGCDGEIARLTGRASSRGGILDAVLDRMADAAIVISLAIFAYRSGWPWPLSALGLPWALVVLLVAGLALTGSLLVSYCSAISRALASRQPERAVGSRDVRLFLIMLAGLSCWFIPWTALPFLALLALLTWLEVLNCLRQVF